MLASLLATGPLTAQTIDTLALRAHSRFLSDDALAGRAAGSEGERIAARYIVSQLTRLGLQPVEGLGSLTQPIPLTAVAIGESTSLMLRSDAGSSTFAHGRDFLINAGGRDAFDGFDGMAVLMPERAAITPLDTFDLSGRVIVLTGGLGADAGTRVSYWASRGAVGVIQLTDYADQLALIAESRGPERIFVNEAAVDDPVWQPRVPVLIAGPAPARAILSAARQAVSSAEGASDPVDLPLRLTLDVAAEAHSLAAVNVAGVLPGSDPGRRDEYVVFAAHYDHLGTGRPFEGDSIYNGFSDNAAGVAMLLAIAEALRTDPLPLNTLFLFTSGEERGLLGSSYFAAVPPISLDRIAAVINLDAGAPPAPPASWRIAGDPDADISRVAADVARRYGWRPEIGPASANSDHWPFLARGVPSIFIVPGDVWEGVDASGRDALRQRWDRYHHPDDEWAEDFPFAGLERYATYALRVARAIGG